MPAPKTILVFGNPFFAPDAVCLLILPALRKQFPRIRFIETDAVEEFHEHGPDLVILDAVMGLERVTLLDDSVEFEAPKRTTMHDFDLAHALQLLKKLKKIRSAKIIGVPLGYDEKKAFNEVEILLEHWP